MKIKGLLLVSLIGGCVWGFSIENGGDRGILVANCQSNLESAADMPGDLICWWQPDTQTATSNIVVTEVLDTATTFLENVKVYPNPWRIDKEGKRPYIVFEVPDGSYISIYTTSGRLVKEFFDVLSPIHWGLDNCENKPISSGMYIYEVKERDGKRKMGKLGIIK